MAEPPVDRSGVLLHFTEGTLAYAGHYLHEGDHPVHTHSFFEVAVVTAGAACTCRWPGSTASRSATSSCCGRASGTVTGTAAGWTL